MSEETVQIEKISESYIKVLSSFPIEQEIKDYFTFKAPGYKFHPKFKARIWDGNVSLYDQRTKRIPIGLYPRLLDYCRDAKVNVAVRSNDNFAAIWEPNDVSIEDVQKFVDSLDLQSSKGSIKARDYQIQAIYESIKNQKITLISPTSSGKSLIIYCLIRWMLEDPSFRVLLMVPNVSLVKQMIYDFKEYSLTNGFDVDQYTQQLFSGQSKELTKKILVTTWQSLKKIADDKISGPRILSTYFGVIVDEAHTSKGKEIQSILEKMHMASYRIGTTGTIDNEKLNQLVIEGFLGPLYKVITTKELIDTNQVSDLKIKCISLKYNQNECKLVKDYKYQDELKYICINDRRNEFLSNIAMACSGTTLILVNLREEHAKPLYEILKEKSKRPVYYVSGTVKADEREVIRLTANKEDCIIVGTYGSISTGTNIPNIRNVIFGSPSKSSIRVLQSIGRGLRLHKDKDKMILIDIIDDFRYKKNENYAYLHALERLKIYRKENFEIDIKEIPF